MITITFSIGSSLLNSINILRWEDQVLHEQFIMMYGMLLCSERSMQKKKEKKLFKLLPNTLGHTHEV